MLGESSDASLVSIFLLHRGGRILQGIFLPATQAGQHHL